MNRGYSLLEVLIVTIVLVIVTAAIFPLLYQGQQSFRGEKQFAEATQEARVALDQISRYIRQAGNDPLEATSVAPIEILSTGHIRINSDITGSVASTTGNSKESTGDPNGSLNSIYERVEVRYDSTRQEIYLDVGYGEELLASNMSSFNLTFFDASGNTTSNPASIVRARIEMVAETEYDDPRTGRISSITLASDVFIRNQAFQLFE